MDIGRKSGCFSIDIQQHARNKLIMNDDAIWTSGGVGDIANPPLYIV